MGKSKFSGVVNSIQKSISKHSPEILTGIGIAGMITTTVLAVKATPKAVVLIKRDSERNHDGDPYAYTKIEAVKSCWKCYIPAAVSGTVSIACLIGANSVNARRNAALATAYKISETALTEYREKVVETIGEKKEKEVRDKVSKKRIEERPINDDEVFVTGKGKTLCYDYLRNKYFETNIDLIKKAENNLNKRMIHDIVGFASLNDFYLEIGLEPIGLGDDLGWNTDHLIDIHLGAMKTPDDRPCIVIDHINAPRYGYDR